MNSLVRRTAQCATVAAAGFACATAAAIDLAPQDITALDSSALRAMYLDCDRLSSETAMDLDTMVSCVMVSDVLLQREFAGNLALQLEWWKSARQELVRMRQFMPAPGDAQR